MRDMIALAELRRALGGDISGRQVLAPGPSHSSKDRSMWVKPSPDAPEGFRAGSFANDDWRACRDYVRRRLGLPAFGNDRTYRRREAPTVNAVPKSPPTSDADALDRQRKALKIWGEARDPRCSI